MWQCWLCRTTVVGTVTSVMTVKPVANSLHIYLLSNYDKTQSLSLHHLREMEKKTDNYPVIDVIR